jgi:hypothetical protein
VGHFYHGDGPLWSAQRFSWFFYDEKTLMVGLLYVLPEFLDNLYLCVVVDIFEVFQKGSKHLIRT